MALTIRPARPGDKPALMAIARRVWGGHDYLPVLFDGWVRRPWFWVGVLRPRSCSHRLKGRVVGCGKATHFGQGEWWLEGLRIAPDLQGKGLGTELSLAILERVLEQRPASVRLSTAEINRDSVAIIGRMGFELILASRLYWLSRGTAGRFLRKKPAAVLDRRRPGPVPSRVLHVSAREALACLAEREELWLGCGLLAHTWKFRAATPRYLKQLERAGRLLGCRERGKLTGLLIVQPHIYNPKNLDVAHVAGTPGSLAAFRGWLARRLRQTRGSGAGAIAAGPQMRCDLASLGFKPERGIGRVLVFELPRH